MNDAATIPAARAAPVRMSVSVKPLAAQVEETRHGKGGEAGTGSGRPEQEDGAGRQALVEPLADRTGGNGRCEPRAPELHRGVRDAQGEEDERHAVVHGPGLRRDAGDGEVAHRHREPAQRRARGWVAERGHV